MALPADVYLTLNQLNVLFQKITFSSFENDKYTAWLDYEAQVAAGTWPVGQAAPTNPYYYVRVAWPSGGAPAWKLNEDVAFLRITERNDPYNVQRHVIQKPYTLAACNFETTYTRVLEVNWTFYGPNSYDSISALRDHIYYPDQHLLLAKNNIFIIPRDITPRRFPELFQGQWWDRSDMTIQFNEKVVRNLEVPFIQSAEVTVFREDKDNIVLEITDETEIHIAGASEDNVFGDGPENEWGDDPENAFGG